MAGMLLVCAGCGTDYYAKKLVEPDNRTSKWYQHLHGSNSELVEFRHISKYYDIPISDGMDMEAWLLKQSIGLDAAGDFTERANKHMGTVLILHDLKESKVSYLPLAEELSKWGYSAVLVDLRAHGRSGGKYVTWGVKEKNDIKEVVDYLLESGDVDGPIYVLGISYGGAVAIHYASIDPRCRGVVAIAPYKDLRSAADGMFTLSGGMLDKVVKRACELAFFQEDDASVIKAAEKMKTPLTIIHGEMDMDVSSEDCQEIIDAAGGPARLKEVPWIGGAMLISDMKETITEEVDRIAKTGLTRPLIKKKDTMFDP